MTPRIEAATRDGRATFPTMWPTSCASAAPSAERCHISFSTFWRPMILAGQPNCPPDRQCITSNISVDEEDASTIEPNFRRLRG